MVISKSEKITDLDIDILKAVEGMISFDVPKREIAKICRKVVKKNADLKKPKNVSIKPNTLEDYCGVRKYETIIELPLLVAKADVCNLIHHIKKLIVHFNFKI